MLRTSWMLPTLAALFGGVLGGVLVQLGHNSLAVSSAMANVQKNVLTTQEVRLTTADGQVVAQLMLWDGQRPILQLGDARCPARFSMGISEQQGQPFLTLSDDNCQRRVTMDLIPDGLPQLAFRDETNVPRARLHLLKDGSPILRLFDPNGRTLWAAAQ